MYKLFLQVAVTGWLLQGMVLGQVLNRSQSSESAKDVYSYFHQFDTVRFDFEDRSQRSQAKGLARDYNQLSKRISRGDENPSLVLKTWLASNPALCSAGGSWSQTGPFMPNEQKNGMLTTVWTPDANANTIYAGACTGGLWKTTDGGANWTNLTDYLRIPSMNISDFVADPSNNGTMYLASASSLSGFQLMDYGIGVLKSTDYGQTWNETGLAWTHIWGANINDLEMDPTNPQVLYASSSGGALASEGIYKTTNGGTTWTHLAPTFWAANLPHSNGVDGAKIVDIEVLPSNSNVIFVGTIQKTLTLGVKAEFYVSTDGGTTWAVGNNPLLTTADHPERFEFATCAATGNTIYALCAKKVHNGSSFGAGANFVYQSTDNGVTWSLIRQVSGGNEYNVDKFEFELNQLNPQKAYFGWVELYKTQTLATGSGTLLLTQTIDTDHDDIRCIQALSSPVQDIVLVATDGGLSKSLNSATSYTSDVLFNGASGNIITQVFDMSISSDGTGVIVAGAQDNGTYSKTSATAAWVTGQWGDGGKNVISWKSPDTVYARSNPSMNISVNRGATFPSSIPNSNLGTGNGWDQYVDYAEMSQNAKNPGVIYLAKGGLFRRYRKKPGGTWDSNFALNGGSMAGKNTWGWDFNRGVSAFAVAPSDTNIIYVALYGWDNSQWPGTFYKSIDAGRTFTEYRPFKASSGGGYHDLYAWDHVNSIVIDPNNPNRVWIGMGGFGSSWQNPSQPATTRVWFTETGGVPAPGTLSAWTDVSTGLPPFPINDLLYRKGSYDELWAGTDVGVYRYNAQTSTWDCYNSGLPVVICNDLEIDYCSDKLYVATFGRGIFETPLPATVAARTLSNSFTIPAGTTLEMNYDLYLDPVVTLTVAGTLNMGAGKRIYVTADEARVVVPGGTITCTHPCNNTNRRWEGIQVNGYNYVYHPAGITATNYATVGNPTHGLVVVTGNGKIEHANTAVSLVDGGLLLTDGATFMNNRRAVEILQFEPSGQGICIGFTNCNDNATAIRNTVFEINDNARFDGAQLNQQITMWAAHGVEILACTFRNLGNSTRFPDLQRGVGVYSIDASPYILGISASPVVKTAFENLTQGVVAEYASLTLSGLDYKTLVDQCTFTGIRKEGVYIHGGTSRARVTRNTFTISTTSSQAASAAVYLESTSSPILAENVFSGGQAPGYGAYIKNCGSAGFEVYKNTFQNIPGTALLSQGIHLGLQISCNTFTSNTGYNVVSSHTAPSELSAQGASNKATGNQINDGTTCSTGSEFDHFWRTYDESVSSIAYRYSGSLTSHIPTCFNRISPSGGATVNPCNSIFNGSNRPSQSEAGYVRSQYETALADDKPYWGAMLDIATIANLQDRLSGKASSASILDLLVENNAPMTRQLLANGIEGVVSADPNEALSPEEQASIALEHWHAGIRARKSSWLYATPEERSLLTSLAATETAAGQCARIMAANWRGEVLQPTYLTLPSRQKGAFVSESSEISLIPNPAQDEVQVVLGAGMVPAEVQLLTADGRELVRLQPTTLEIVLQLSQLTNGLYIVRVTDAAGVTHSRMLSVQH